MLSLKLFKIGEFVSINRFLARCIFSRALSNGTTSKIDSALSAGDNNRINVGGYPINYTVVGNGPHVVFCLPGILGNMKIHTESQIKSFDKEKFTYVTWDQPGYAKSTPPDRIPTDDSLAEDTTLMVEFMNKLGYKYYSVMGWSGGGCSALLAAIRYPHIVRKLVIWGAFSFVDKKDAENFKLYECKENQKGKMMEILVNEYGDEFFSKHFGAWMHCFSRIYSHYSGEFCSKKLHEIKCPTLILHGTQDGLIKIKHGEFLEKNIKNSRLVTWKNGKHNIHLRYPNEFNTLAQNFLLDDG